MTLSVRLLAALMMSVMLIGLAAVYLLAKSRDKLMIYADEKQMTETKPAMTLLPDTADTADTADRAGSEPGNTPSGNASGNTAEITPTPVAEPVVQISVEEPSGWYNKAMKLKIKAEDIAESGAFVIKSAKAKIGQNGSFVDITDSMAVEMSENGTVYIEITDTAGNTYSKSQRISCFDFTKPTLISAVNSGSLTVQATDNDSGIKAIYVNGFEFNNLTNGALTIRMEQYDTGYQYFAVQAMDNAGNLSETYRVNNPYYLKKMKMEEKFMIKKEIN